MLNVSTGGSCCPVCGGESLLGVLHLQTRTPQAELVHPAAKSRRHNSKLCCVSGGQDHTLQVLKVVAYLTATHYFQFSLCPCVFSSLFS